MHEERRTQHKKYGQSTNPSYIHKTKQTDLT